MKKLEGIDTLREKVRQRDNWTCQGCGKVWISGQRRFDVHHLEVEMESIRSYVYDKSNMHKMLTLCHKCHLNLPHNIAKLKRAPSEETLKKREMMLKLYNNRYTFSTIGKMFGISRQRAHKIVQKALSTIVD